MSAVSYPGGVWGGAPDEIGLQRGDLIVTVDYSDVTLLQALSIK